VKFLTTEYGIPVVINLQDKLNFVKVSNVNSLMCAFQCDLCNF
jgi:hypothetical protein